MRDLGLLQRPGDKTCMSRGSRLIDRLHSLTDSPQSFWKLSACPCIERARIRKRGDFCFLKYATLVLAFSELVNDLPVMNAHAEESPISLFLSLVQLELPTWP